MSYCQSSSSSECSDSDFKVQHVRKSRTFKNTNFEKNYPKNILISILDSLDLTNQQTIYMDLKIFAKDIQKRNSASLQDIYSILTHPLMKSINKPSYEILASNILLQNSKISKKAFHLKIIREIFSFENDIPFDKFKNQMKNRAKINLPKEGSNIKIFKYQSSTIFLLTIFCNAIQNNPNRTSDSIENKDTSDDQNQINLNRKDLNKTSKKSNRQLLKPLIHLLTKKLNRQRWGKQNIDHIKQLILEAIKQTEYDMQNQLKLSEGVPNMRIFSDQVVKKCFNLIEQRKKITFSDLQKLIKKFESISLNTVANKIQAIEPIEDLHTKSQQPKAKSIRQKSSQKLKIFSPLLVIPPSQRFIKRENL